MHTKIRRDLKKIFDREMVSPNFFSNREKQSLKGPYAYPSDHEQIRKNLLGGHNHEKINSIFLEENEVEFLTSQEDFKSLIDNGSFNPYSDYKLCEYFVKTKTIKLLDIVYTFKDNPKLIKNVVHIGNKGSGKTALQNIWLKQNNEKLERNNIFWVRCDGHKLYQLWLGFQKELEENDNQYEIIDETNDLSSLTVKRLVDIDEYLDIQFLYVFSKYCMDEKRPFFEKILKNMQNEKPVVDYPVSRNDRTTQPKLLYSCITDIRTTIKKEEVDEGTNYSYAYKCVMKGSIDTSQLEKRRWIAISKKLQAYFHQHDIWILKIVDGVDNVHINEKSAEPYYKHMLTEAHKFSRRRPKEKNIHYMALRERTLIDILVGHPIQLDTKLYLEQHSIHHSPACFKEIITQRYAFSKDKHFKTGGLYDQIARSIVSSVSPDVGDQSHNNAREFLHNKLTLISQVYYRIKQLNKRNVNLESHIKTLRPRNRYLNGRLFLNTKRQWGDLNTEPGVCCMNLFYFDLDNYPCMSQNDWVGLCKTRILQMLNKNSTISEALIINYLSEVLLYPKALVLDDIKHLRAFGMIDSKYDKAIMYVISKKGRRYLEHVYSDIDTLYYFALDSALPVKFIDNQLVIGHNNSLSTRTFYPSCAITTVTSFAFFLMRKNALEEKDRNEYAGEIYDYLGKVELPLSDRSTYAHLLISTNRLVKSMDASEARKVRERLENISADCTRC